MSRIRISVKDENPVILKSGQIPVRIGLYGELLET